MSKTATELGKFLRKLRIDFNESSKNMSLKLDISPSFLSSVETGKKQAPFGIEDKIEQHYKLSTDDISLLRDLASQSRILFRIKAKDPKAKHILGIMHRNMDKMNDDELQQILDVLEKIGDK